MMNHEIEAEMQITPQTGLMDNVWDGQMEKASSTEQAEFDLIHEQAVDVLDIEDDMIARKSPLASCNSNDKNVHFSERSPSLIEPTASNDSNLIVPTASNDSAQTPWPGTPLPPDVVTREEIPWLVQDQIDLQTSKESFFAFVISYFLLAIYFVFNLLVTLPWLVFYFVILLIRLMYISLMAVGVGCGICGVGCVASKYDFEFAKAWGWIFAWLHTIHWPVVALGVNMLLAEIDSEIADRIEEEGLQSYQIALCTFAGCICISKMLALLCGRYAEETLVKLARLPADKVEIQNPDSTILLDILNFKGCSKDCFATIKKFGQSRLLDMLIYLVSLMIAVVVGFSANWVLDARLGFHCDYRPEVDQDSYDCQVNAVIQGARVCCHVLPHMWDPGYVCGYLGGTVLVFYGLYYSVARHLMAHFGFLSWEGAEMERDDNNRIPLGFTEFFYKQNLYLTKWVNHEVAEWQELVSNTTDRSMSAKHMICIEPTWILKHRRYFEDDSMIPDEDKLNDGRKVPAGTLLRINKRSHKLTKELNFRKYLQFGRLDDSDAWVLISVQDPPSRFNPDPQRVKYFETVQTGCWPFIWYYMLFGWLWFSEDRCCCRRPFKPANAGDIHWIKKMWYAICCGWLCVGADLCDDPYPIHHEKYRSKADGITPGFVISNSEDAFAHRDSEIEELVTERMASSGFSFNSFRGSSTATVSSPPDDDKVNRRPRATRTTESSV